jgi:PTH1 family peptidyl-tRNA hydrolase
MKLIFAQGNPGSQYVLTRHNVGFIVLDALADANSGSWKTDTKIGAELCKLSIDGETALLAKPLSFYNETGLVARKLVDFYKLTPASDVLVIHDELALPFGTVRVREQGSDAGNNGIKSLNSHLGAAYWRARIGIWNDLRDRMNDADFVLARFSADEQQQLAEIIRTTVFDLIKAFVHGKPLATSVSHEKNLE